MDFEVVQRCTWSINLRRDATSMAMHQLHRAALRMVLSGSPVPMRFTFVKHMDTDILTAGDRMF